MERLVQIRRHQISSSEAGSRERILGADHHVLGERGGFGKGTEGGGRSAYGGYEKL